MSTKNPENNEKKQREMLEMQVLEMQLRQFEQQAMMIEQQILEYQSIMLNLEELKMAKPGKTMLFPFSRDIFVEGKFEKSDVLVNVGSKTLIKQSIDEAKKLVEKQKNSLLNANEELHSEIEKVIARISELEKNI